MPAHPDLSLRRAFLDTDYGTAGERLRLGCSPGPPPGPPPAWSMPGQRWAILTAWNPRGLARGRASNIKAQQQLRAALLGWPQLAGVNGAGEWAEPSLIVTGPHLRQAARLGQRFGQAAVLWGVGGRAALVWCAGAEADLRLERFWLVAAPTV